MRSGVRQRRFAAAAGVAAALAVAAWLAAALALVGATFDDAERAAAAAIVEPHGALLLLMALSMVLLTAGMAAGVASWFYKRHLAAPRQLVEQARVLLQTEAAALLDGRGDEVAAGFAETVNGLVAQREQLRREITQRVAEGSRRVEQERSRLAALMSELTHSVVVCNLDGRVLLVNQRARQQFRALSGTPTLAGGSELIGLGRSLYTVFDRAVVAHALDTVRRRLRQGAATATAQFVTVTGTGQLLRAVMAPVRDSGAGDPAADGVSGFVLLLDNITRDYERDSAQDHLLQGLTEGSRASLGNLQAAVELLDDPTLDDATRERFLAVVREEAQSMARRVNDIATRSAQEVKTRWPLEDMSGTDFVAVAQRRIEGVCRARTAVDEADPALWLRVDSYALLQALSYLACRLAGECDVRTISLRLRPAGGRAQLDLVWPGLPISTETVTSWESEPMHFGNEASPLSVRDVMDRHGGEFWFERDRARQQAFFRFLLPLAQSGDEATRGDIGVAAVGSRPEYYDFDLFDASASHHELDDRDLAGLNYTVFDTETTGLDPSAGDRIIQIGAARLVNGRLVRPESFEQLVDPKRDLPDAGIAIHGITPEMLRRQPTLDQVLPVFHAYARDTVLVAHNAAFDMRFLQLAQQDSGVVFDQPVLDTLLLSAVVHPNQDSHRLEAIAARFGVTVVGRHTALGDAMVTAEVFLRLIPLLAAMGIRTLAQAREASEKTFYARLKY